MATRRRLAHALAVGGALVLLAGCTPSIDGVVGISRSGSTLRGVIVPCGNDHIEQLHLEEMKDYYSEDRKPELGSLDRDEPVRDVLEFDLLDPGPDWSGLWIKELSDLSPGVVYGIQGYGVARYDHWRTDFTQFTTQSLAELAEGSWIYRDPETLDTRTAPSLDRLLEVSC